MLCAPKSKAERRYVYRLAVITLFYLVFLFIAQWTFHHLHPTGPFIYLLAVLPAIPMVASFGVVGFYIAEETDEFERSIAIQSMLWGFGAALSISTFWGFLEDYVAAPHLSPVYLYLFFWIFMGISQPFIRMRYR